MREEVNMSWVLAAYSNHGCQEFIMPETDNINYSIELDHKIFEVDDTVCLRFEITGNMWRFVGTSENCVLGNGSVQPGKLISSGDTIYILYGAERITVLVAEFLADISRMKKYRIGDAAVISVGSGSDHDIVILGVPLISRNHASITVNQGNCTIADKSRNGTFVNGKRIHETKKIEYGDCISLFGLQIIWFGDVIAVGHKWGQVQCAFPELLASKTTVDDAPKVLPPKGKTYFRRSPRNLPKFYTEEIEIEAPPQPSKVVRRPLLLTIGPSLTMTLPMIAGTIFAIAGARRSGSSASMYMYTGIVIAVLSAVIGVAWALINLSYSKRQEIAKEQLRVKKYNDYLAYIERDISEKYMHNYQNLNYIYPSADKCAQYTSAVPDLWNRNTSHNDFLFLRLGTGSCPFQCTLISPQKKFSVLEDELLAKSFELCDKFKQLKDVPLGIDLKDKSLIGIVGRSKERSVSIMRSLVVQTAANICYTDVKMVFLFDGSTPTDLAAWSFAKWIPHVWSPDHKFRYFAANKGERSEVCFSLANTLRSRAEGNGSSLEAGKGMPHYIVFVSSPELLEGMPVAKYLLDPHGNLGVTTILLAERFEQLPNNCVDIIESDNEFSGFFNIGHDAETRIYIDFDFVSPDAAERFARSISAVEVQEAESSGEVPESLSFLDMYQVGTLDDLNIPDRWAKNRTYETLGVPIGQKSGGETLYLDIHERFHGPHGLVAGTTGSGKSEILQTYILSLAVNFSPNDVAFFLIDFKGGGMANLFSNLPHMAGYISNLSGNQIHRAMVSIKSENRRRQELFCECGVNHIDQYTRLIKNGEVSTPIPHLFIIIDEFAELKRSEPEFMGELISVAQVGRSLGVHLILATQKPSGTVDDNIWSNTRFKLCLRVQNKQDSNDVLHKPDAAYLTQVGRCYLQVGNDEIYELFQSGWSGAVYHNDPSVEERVVAQMWDHIGRSATSGANRKALHSEGRETTQLAALVEHLAAIADTSLADQKRFRLWLPILSQEIYLFDIFKERSFNGEAWPIRTSETSLSVPVGVYDDPANQAQAPLVIDLAENGHVVICGSALSGKSAFVQTLLFALVHKYSPEYINIYILDYSNHLLEPFSGLAHVGGTVFDTQADQTEKLFVLLSHMIAERKKKFSGGSYTQYVKTSGRNVPYILVVVDNYANFREKTENKYESDLIKIAREGANYGIYLIVTAGGFGTGDLQNRIAENFRSVICLEMGDRFKYSEVLRINHLDIFPEGNIKGRGLANVGGRILEFQTALSIGASDDYQRSEKLKVCFSEMNRVWTGRYARRIPTIPQNPVWDDFLQCITEGSPSAAPDIPFAWNEKDATIACVDLSKTYCWLILGQARTGKTNLLRVMAASASQCASKRYIIDFSGNKLSRFATEYQATYVSSGSGLFEMLKSILPEFKERNAKKQELLASGMDESDIYVQIQAFQPIFIFIDSLDEFFHMVYSPPDGVGAMAEFVENIMEKGYLHNIYFFAAYDYSSAAHSIGCKAFNSYISYKSGIHLGGNTASQRIFDFSSIPYSEQAKVTRPGVGLIPPDAYTPAARKVMIPLLKG